jgi:hypothetical protein
LIDYISPDLAGWLMPYSHKNYNVKVKPKNRHDDNDNIKARIQAVKWRKNPPIALPALLRACEVLSLITGAETDTILFYMADPWNQHPNVQRWTEGYLGYIILLHDMQRYQADPRLVLPPEWVHAMRIKRIDSVFQALRLKYALIHEGYQAYEYETYE